MNSPLVFKEYIWLVNTIYQAKKISLREISNKWKETLENWMHLEPVNGTRLNVDDMTEEDYQKLLTEHFAAA